VQSSSFRYVTYTAVVDKKLKRVQWTLQRSTNAALRRNAEECRNCKTRQRFCGVMCRQRTAVSTSNLLTISFPLRGIGMDVQCSKGAIR